VRFSALSLLRKPNLTNQVGVARVGAQRIEYRVGTQANQSSTALLVCGVEPLEGAGDDMVSPNPLSNGMGNSAAE
jgi:hypothetical protein